MNWVAIWMVLGIGAAHFDEQAREDSRARSSHLDGYHGRVPVRCMADPLTEI